MTKVLFLIVIAFIIVFLALVFITAHQESVINTYKEQNEDLESLLELEKSKSFLLSEKLGNLTASLELIKPGIGAGIENILNDVMGIEEGDPTDFYSKLSSLPVNSRDQVIQKYINLHGLSNNYTLTIKGMIFPLDPDTTFIGSKYGEFALRPDLFTSDPTDTEWHPALDLVNYHNQVIRAPSGGYITKVDYERNGGLVIYMKHVIDGITYKSYFAHLSKTYVESGEYVRQGDKIGLIGETGAKCMGKHLHWSVSMIKDGITYRLNPVAESTHGNNYVSGYYFRGSIRKFM